MPKRALIVIDVQNEYFDGKLPISDPPTATSLANITRAMEAATAAYGAGSGALVSLLDARRSLLDIRVQRLELQLDAARHQVQLQYYAYQEAQS